MSYTYLGTTSSGTTDKNCTVVVYLLQASSGYRSNMTTARDALRESLGDAYSSGFISGYEIHEYDTDGTLTINPSGAPLQQINEWRDTNGFTENANYIGIHRKSTNSPGATGGGLAWEQPVPTQISFVKGNPSVSAPHECMHAYIQGTCDYIWNSMIYRSDDNGSPNEHDLGSTINLSGTMLHTPFGGAGASVPSEHGRCSVSDASVGNGRTQKLSTCTKKALQYSAQHVFTDHSSIPGDIC